VLFTTVTLMIGVSSHYIPGRYFVWQEIRQYLKSHGRQLMIWRCTNAIQHFVNNDQLLPHIGQQNRVSLMSNGVNSNNLQIASYHFILRQDT